MVVAMFMVSSLAREARLLPDTAIAPEVGWRQVAGDRAKLQPRCNQLHSWGDAAAISGALSVGRRPLRARRAIRLVAEVLAPFGAGEVAPGGPAGLALPHVRVEVPARRAEEAFGHQLAIGRERGHEAASPGRDRPADGP